MDNELATNNNGSDSLHVYQKAKVVFLGEQSVGKSSLINRFMYNCFDASYQATIGIDFLTKTITTSDKTVRLQLWDTAGQERFRSLIPSYIRDSMIAVVIYDITDSRTFAQIDNWINDVKAERGDDVVVVLVANKTDLNDKREVSALEGEARAREMNVLFMETSAKSGLNVQKLFTNIVYKLPIESNDEILRNEIEIRLKDNTETMVSPPKQCHSCIY